MNFLSLFVLIPVLMLGGLLLASDIKQIRAFVRQELPSCCFLP